MPSDEYPWGYNYYICDEALSALFEQEKTETDPAKRQALFHEITKLMTEKVYYLGIWEDPDVWIVNPRLTGYKFSGVTPFYNIHEWDVTE